MIKMLPYVADEMTVYEVNWLYNDLLVDKCVLCICSAYSSFYALVTF